MKLAFWIVFVVGFVGCTAFGIGPVLQRAGGDWLSPYMLAGCVLGAALVALAIAFATGFRPSLLPTDTAMVVALVTVVAAKVVVALVQSGLSAFARG